MNMLVTAGPTREAIDPIRFISNRSTGKMGYAVAMAAVVAGHEVVLVSGPVALKPPDGVTLVNVTSAAEMLDAVLNHIAWCRALVMTAAVADWRPAVESGVKLKKETLSPVLRLERTPDILMELHSHKEDRIFVGFVAETGELQQEAMRKVREKGLDLVVANDVSRSDAGFEVDTNRVTLVYPDGRMDAWPLLSKSEIAERLVRVVAAAE